MSRSFKKVIAFGKSTRGRQSRCKTYGDYAAKKARKENRPIIRQHYRHCLQTLDDYVDYVLNHFYIETIFNDMFDRRRWSQYQRFLDNREETQDLVLEFATILWKKDRSK